MTARDDYPHLAWLETARSDGCEMEKALDEIDWLRKELLDALSAELVLSLERVKR